MLQLREYQREAVYNTIASLKKSADPVLIDASVSAGKTYMVAGLMQWIERSHRNSLCLTMTSELVDQNSECYLDNVDKCSIFCATLNKKNWRLPSVFASPQTLWSAIKKGHPISKKKFSLICVDEAHNINFRDAKTTYMRIIAHYRELNPNLRIVGLTGTPFRGRGESIVGEDKFFKEKTADIGMAWLIKNSFVVPPIYGSHGKNEYDFSELKVQSNGKFKASELAEASEGKKRLTHDIVQEVIKNSQDRGSVLIFASTIEHCKEVLESLPADQSCMITGQTPDKERQRLIRRIKAGEIKYTVNLNVLTVGFSAPVIDHVVFLRPTESAVLWVQAVGRGIRQLEGKENCLVSDYAGNLDRLGDVDNPVITDMVKNRDREIEKDVPCPECGEMNSIFARRCVGYVDGVRCGFFFDFKPCPKCETQNDTTARACRECGHELIDPNKKLSRKSSFRIGIEPIRVPVTAVEYTRHPGKKNKCDTLRVDYLVELPNKNTEMITEWFSPDASGYPLHICKRDFISKHAPELEGHSLSMILASKHKIRSPSHLLINKMIGAKYLSIVIKEF